VQGVWGDLPNSPRSGGIEIILIIYFILSALFLQDFPQKRQQKRLKYFVSNAQQKQNLHLII